jgi:hypothetical protein
MNTTVLKTTAILLILAVGISSCRKESGIQQDIVRTWIKEKTMSGGTGDTIVFTNDHRIEKYFTNYAYGYSIGYKLKADTMFIVIKNQDGFMMKDNFKYSQKENRLTIFGFTFPFSLVQVVREDVVFRKIK